MVSKPVKVIDAVGLIEVAEMTLGEPVSDCESDLVPLLGVQLGDSETDRVQLKELDTS